MGANLGNTVGDNTTFDDFNKIAKQPVDQNRRREVIATALMPWALTEEWRGKSPTCTPKNSAKTIHEAAAYHACDAAEALMVELDRRAK